MTYSVETREYSFDGEDCFEEHYDFDSKEDVQSFVNTLDGEKQLYAVLEYADGQTGNPKDITRQFVKKRVW